MQIEIDTASFIVYRSTSLFNLKQRYRINILGSILLVAIGFFFIWFFGTLFADIVTSRILGWGLFILIFTLWFSLGYLFIRLVQGRLIEIGRITFAFNGVEFHDFENKLIQYDDIIYLSSDYERPQNQFERHPPAKTYLMHIVTQENKRYRFVVSRLSTHPMDRVDLIDLLQRIRKQNHHLYKSFRGVKRDFIES